MSSSVEQLFAKKAPRRTSDADKTSTILAQSQACDEDTAAEIVKEIQALIQSNDVMVFSKSYCPYCRQAKMALRSIPDLEFVAVEMDDGDHEHWQSQVAKLALTVAVPEAKNNNTSSVPQIFVKQQYIGGADDLAEMFTDERLAKMLGRPLYPT